MKNLLKFLTISLLAALILLVSVQLPAGSAATTCGQLVSGHTQPGGQPSDHCPDDGKPIFHAGDHYFTDSRDVCPYDGTALVSGHAPQ